MPFGAAPPPPPVGAARRDRVGPFGREASPSDRTAARVLYGVYGTVAAVLLVLPHTRQVRDHLASPPTAV